MTAFYIGFFRRLLLDCNFSARNFKSGLLVFRLKIDNFMFLCFRQVGKKVEFSVAVMEFYVFTGLIIIGASITGIIIIGALRTEKVAPNFRFVFMYNYRRVIRKEEVAPKF